MNISEVKKWAAAYDSWVSTHSNYNLIKEVSQGQNNDFCNFRNLWLLLAEDVSHPPPLLHLC